MDSEVAQALRAVRDAFFDEKGHACDYAALGASRERGRLAACLGDLGAFDPKRVRIPAQTAFWINVFNAVVLRDAPELGMVASVREAKGFFERERLKVGGFGYSLDDIEHGLLRGNVPKMGALRAPMRKDDPRLAHMPLAYDERMHFAMFSACRSSPALCVYEAGDLDRQMEEATQAYIRRTVRVDDGGAIIILPRQFKWYAGDFGGERGAVDFVLARLEDDTVDLIDKRQGRFKVKYDAFDWALNRK
jgi:hypothetical protein